MGELDDLVKEFLIESRDNLDQLDRDFVGLEKDPTAADLLAAIFRTIHTIKGTSGFLAFSKLEALTHAGENLLSRLRDGKLRLDAKITSALLAMVDRVRAILASIEAEGTEGPNDYRELIDTLNRLQTLDGTKSPVEYGSNKSASSSTVQIPAEPDTSAGATPPIGQLLVETAGVDPAAVEAARELQRQGDVRSIGEILVAHGALSPAAAIEVIESQRESRAVGLGDTSIRVDVALLDKLMNLVGELVLARNQIVQFSSRVQDPSFSNASQRLDLITTELQGGAMKTRMQPIGNLWSRLPRVVRDLAVAGGKHIRVEMKGKDTELDKTLIEAIKDPLTHVVRNSADHGIESPEQRVLAGKPPEGCIFLRAFHEGGQVNIEISDDGAGIDLERVKQKALVKGLITADQAGRMTEREVANLVFLPGLSTAEKVTSVSGRGVGMDVVKTNVEKIGGTLDLHSRSGQGTTLKIKIPLTLAIIPALIVTCGGDRYAIPQVSLLELVRLDGDDVHRRIETIQGVPVYRLRGNLLPLVYLDRALQISRAPQIEPQRHSAADGSAVNIIVLQADGRQFGLVVDDISDTEEIVVKPLSKQLKSINTFAGATIMGDGKVALILDVLGLAQQAQVLSGVRDRAVSERETSPLEAHENAHRAVLLFQCGDHGRMAIDLDLVARLEEFSEEMIEFAGNQEVVQYRGEIMPLIRVAEALQKEPRKPLERTQESLHVIVYSAQGRSVGLVVGRILDIIEESFIMQRQARSEGIQGSAIIQKRVTDVLDVPALIAAAASQTALANFPG